MSKTLADMNPEQCAQCVGMWATVATERYIAVIVRAEDAQYAQMLAPGLNDYYTASLESVTPRPDLPRAWNPEGAPVEMDIETDIVRDHPRGGMVGTFESPEYVNQPSGTTMRRFVGEWEEA